MLFFILVLIASFVVVALLWFKLQDLMGIPFIHARNLFSRDYEKWRIVEVQVFQTSRPYVIRKMVSPKRSPVLLAPYPTPQANQHSLPIPPDIRGASEVGMNRPVPAAGEFWSWSRGSNQVSFYVLVTRPRSW